MSDTRMLAGSEAMVTALILYSGFKDAAKVVPGIKDVMVEVGQRFQQGGCRVPPSMRIASRGQ